MSDEKQKSNTKLSPRLAIPFFVVLGVLTVCSFLIPLRPTVSYTEKRELAKFPAFSVETLISGEYFDDITIWFSDTFPGREGWMELSNAISGTHGYSEISIQGQLPVSVEASPESMEELPQDPELSAAVPAETESAEGQEETGEATEENHGIDWEERGNAAEQIDKDGAVIQVDDAAFSALNFSDIQSTRYAESLSKLARAVAGKGVRVVSAPPPTAVGIMVNPKYLEMLKCVDQGDTLSYIYERVAPEVVAVDTVSKLRQHNEEYIYFRTDHHWTALGAYYCYEAICEALGYAPAPLDSFEPWEQGEFKGSLYGKAPRPNKLKIDTVTAYIPQGDIKMMVYENTGGGRELPLLQDTTKRNINAKYLTFMWNDNPLSVVTNASIPDAPKCIVVKDSYGNCFVPFLTQTYSEVYAIDYRKYNRYSIYQLIEKYDIDDVIFLPYMTATQSGMGNDFFEGLCKLPKGYILE